MRRSFAARIIYIFPFIADCIVGQMLFVGTVRAAQMGHSATVVTSVLAVWGTTYVVACFIVGQILSRTNAVMLASLGCLVLLITSLLTPQFGGFGAIAASVCALGIGTSLFFPAFQIFMKAVDGGQNRSVAQSTGWYTLSWSMGLAVGPFVSGYLMELGEHGWKYACYFSSVVSVFPAVGLWLLKHHADRQPHGADASRKRSQSTDPDQDFSSAPDLAWLGWIGGGVTWLVVYFVRGLFPLIAEKELFLSESEQGTVFFLLSATQGVTGLLLCHSTILMYRARSVLLFGLIGAIGLICFTLRVDRTWVFYAGAVCLGTYSGFSFFYIVFHSLTHPGKAAKYISLNEMVIGAAGIAGPLLAGVLATASNSSVVPFVFSVGMVVCAITLQATVHRLRRLADEQADRTLVA